MSQRVTKRIFVLATLFVAIALGAESSVAAKKNSHLQRVSGGAGNTSRAKADGNGAQSLRAKGDLRTEHVFDGAMVNGKYQLAGEALAIVEKEKQMNDLIGSRRDFKDRLSIERARLKQAGTGQ